MENISGITITEHQNSKRIIDIRIEDEILDKLIFPFNISSLHGINLEANKAGKGALLLYNAAPRKHRLAQNISRNVLTCWKVLGEIKVCIPLLIDFTKMCWRY